MQWSQAENELLLRAAQKYDMNFGKLEHLFKGRTKLELMDQFSRLKTAKTGSVAVLEQGSKFQRRTGRAQRLVEKQEDKVYFSEQKLRDLQQFINDHFK